MFWFIYHLCYSFTKYDFLCLGQIPKVADTCNFQEIMDGYYKTLFPLNPGSIRPIMPSTSEHEILFRPHGRESLSSSSSKPVFVK
jgi:putative glutathione S-transferase